MPQNEANEAPNLPNQVEDGIAQLTTPLPSPPVFPGFEAQKNSPNKSKHLPAIAALKTGADRQKEVQRLLVNTESAQEKMELCTLYVYAHQPDTEAYLRLFMGYYQQLKAGNTAPTFLHYAIVGHRFLIELEAANLSPTEYKNHMAELDHLVQKYERHNGPYAEKPALTLMAASVQATQNELGLPHTQPISASEFIPEYAFLTAATKVYGNRHKAPITAVEALLEGIQTKNTFLEHAERKLRDNHLLWQLPCAMLKYTQLLNQNACQPQVDAFFAALQRTPKLLAKLSAEGTLALWHTELAAKVAQAAPSAGSIDVLKRATANSPTTFLTLKAMAETLSDARVRAHLGEKLETEVTAFIQQAWGFLTRKLPRGPEWYLLNLAAFREGMAPTTPDDEAFAQWFATAQADAALPGVCRAVLQLMETMFAKLGTKLLVNALRAQAFATKKHNRSTVAASLSALQKRQNDAETDEPLTPTATLQALGAQNIQLVPIAQIGDYTPKADQPMRRAVLMAYAQSFSPKTAQTLAVPAPVDGSTPQQPVCAVGGVHTAEATGETLNGEQQMYAPGQLHVVPILVENEPHAAIFTTKKPLSLSVRHLANQVLWNGINPQSLPPKTAWKALSWPEAYQAKMVTKAEPELLQQVTDDASRAYLAALGYRVPHPAPEYFITTAVPCPTPFSPTPTTPQVFLANRLEAAVSTSDMFAYIGLKGDDAETFIRDQIPAPWGTFSLEKSLEAGTFHPKFPDDKTMFVRHFQALGAHAQQQEKAFIICLTHKAIYATFGENGLNLPHAVLGSEMPDEQLTEYVKQYLGEHTFPPGCMAEAERRETIHQCSTRFIHTLGARVVVLPVAEGMARLAEILPSNP